MFGNFGAGEIILLLIIFVIPLLFIIIPLIDILKNEFKGNNKIVWTLVVLFLPVLGGILYLFIGRGQKNPKESWFKILRNITIYNKSRRNEKLLYKIYLLVQSLLTFVIEFIEH